MSALLDAFDALCVDGRMDEAAALSAAGTQPVDATIAAAPAAEREASCCRMTRTALGALSDESLDCQNAGSWTTFRHCSPP
jgi:hypothetical protein